ncbi:MAG: hypothetical protein FJ098_12760 [Deltaproteobacteria bacterium]|nr:hypothetical protein [Deltaproteobacteria bacterium]
MRTGSWLVVLVLAGCGGDGAGPGDPGDGRARDAWEDRRITFPDVPPDRVHAEDSTDVADRTDGCASDCTGRACGDDGCGGSCGTCSGPQESCLEGTCVCGPLCPPGSCGADGCGGACPACGLDQVCIQGTCACAYAACGDHCCPKGLVCHGDQCCVPQCEGKECGDDGCGGSCGTCPAVAPVCDQGTCALECHPACDGKECGPDGCGGSCGPCPGGVCLEEPGLCCQPDCEGKECGPDGCGGSCGSCPEGAVCLEWGACCAGSCLGLECGDDGCGGSCGDCPEGQACAEGHCVTDPAWIGCSDGSREGFLSVADYPLIAACGGAWTVPGIHNEVPACGRQAGNTGANAAGTGCNVTDLCAEGWHVCLGKADVLYRSPKGCTEVMLGAQSPAFFLARTSSTGAFNCAPDTIGAPQSVNDLFGCGDLGCAPSVDSCYPLDRASHDLCKAIRNKPTSNCTCYFKGELPPSDPAYQEGNFTDVVCQPSSGGCGWCRPLDYYNKLQGVYHPDAWSCGTNGDQEALNAVKSLPDEQGGVLCCQDQCASELDCPSGQVCLMSTCQDP